MNYTLKELLDIPKLIDLLNILDDIRTFPCSVNDIEGNILIATSWQDICVKFHRVNRETEQKCMESDQHNKVRLEEGEAVFSYICPLGLVDTASPIVIEGKHIGNVYVGQFFLEPPDEHYMSGIDAIVEIREKEKESGLHQPVIALTAFSMRGDKERYLDAGFDGYVSKPLSIKELISEMSLVMGKSAVLEACVQLS